VIQRRDVNWGDVGEPDGSRPSKRRPVLIVSDDLYNSSTLATVAVVTLTSTFRLGDLPGTSRSPRVGPGWRERQWPA
jgi:mRNA interferase MazF